MASEQVTDQTSEIPTPGMAWWELLKLQGWRQWLLAGMAGLMLVSYYAVASWQFPDDPLDVVALYRGYGDVDCFAAAASYGGLEIGEPWVPEHLGEGVRTYPIPSLALHAVLMKMFHVPGFILADFLCGVAFFVAVLMLMRAVGIGETLASLAALGAVYAGHLGATYLGWDMVMYLHSFRFPRQLVSGIFMALFVGLTIGGVSRRMRRDLWYWVGVGASFGLFTQTDPFSAVAAGFWLVVVFLYLLGSKSEGWLALIKGGVLLTGAFVVVMGTFLIQRMVEHPDLIQRMGTFPVDRWPLFWESHLWRQQVVSVVVVPLIATGLLLVKPRGERVRGSIAAVWLLACLTGISYVAMPLMALVMGKLMQPYHFLQSFQIYSSLQILATGVLVAQVLVQRLPDEWKARIIQPRVSGGLVLLAVVLAGWGDLQHRLDYSPEGHTRSGHPEYAGLEDYRRHFVELTAFMKLRKAEQPAVLTFDTQVFNWWAGFHGGQFMLATVNETAILDAEIERRLVLAGRLLGMSEPEFVHFLVRRYVVISWWSHSKHQASKAFTYGELDDYLPAAQADIASSSVYNNWLIHPPISEMKRMLALYQATAYESASFPRCDMVVLTNDESLAGFAPREAEFELVFANDVFRVYERRSTE